MTNPCANKGHEKEVDGMKVKELLIYFIDLLNMIIFSWLGQGRMRNAKTSF